MRIKVSTDNLVNTIFFFGGMWCVFFSGSSVLRPYYVILWPVFVIAFSIILFPKIIDTIKTPRISNQIILYFVYFLCCLVSIFISYNMQASISFTERLLLAILFSIGVSNDKKNYSTQQKIIGLFLFFLLIVSYIELFFPSVYRSYFLPLLNGQEGYYLRSGTFGMCIQGFTIGISKNGLWMTIGFALYLSKVVVGKKNVKIYGLLLLYFIMIFCTGKRSYSLISIFLMIWGISLSHANDKFKKKIMIIPIVVIGLVLGGLFLSRYIPSLNAFIVRSREMTSDGDISNGRFSLYEYAINNIAINPLGIGIDVTNIHNSYLQMVLELGWFGGLLSIIVFFVPIVYVMPYLKRILNLDFLSDIEKEYFLFSVFLNVIVFLSAFVATPFQWHDVIMLLIMCQINMLEIYNRFFNTSVGNKKIRSMNLFV